jgi:hypothetical protein
VKVSRRTVLLTGASSAALACTPAAPPVVPEKTDPLALVLQRALDSARKAGATYADARIVRRRWQRVATREDIVAELYDNET